jgi:hypothetical protein
MLFILAAAAAADGDDKPIWLGLLERPLQTIQETFGAFQGTFGAFFQGTFGVILMMITSPFGQLIGL